MDAYNVTEIPRGKIEEILVFTPLKKWWVVTCVELRKCTTFQLNNTKVIKT